jgi:hypothetical protein
MIIDPSYFIIKVNLPQSGNTEGNADIQAFIDIYETEYLQKFLGYELWKAFTEGIEGSGVPDQRWTDLLQGREFAYGGRTYKWTGFENAEKISPIANYVYYQFIDDNAEQTTLVGMVAPATDNATRSNPMQKLVSARNRMVDMNTTLRNFLEANRDVYPEWIPCYNELLQKKNSLDL